MGSVTMAWSRSGLYFVSVKYETHYVRVLVL